jgi:hypothetical protein
MNEIEFSTSLVIEVLNKHQKMLEMLADKTDKLNNRLGIVEEISNQLLKKE